MTITYLRSTGPLSTTITTDNAHELREALQAIDDHADAKRERFKVHVVDSVSGIADLMAKIFGDTRPTTGNDETGEDARDIPADDGANLCDKQSVYLSLANDEGGGFIFGDIEDHTGASKVFGEDVKPHDGEDRRIRIGPDHFTQPGTVHNIASHEYNAGVLAIMLCRDLLLEGGAALSYEDQQKRAKAIIDCYDNPEHPYEEHPDLPPAVRRNGFGPMSGTT